MIIASRSSPSAHTETRGSAWKLHEHEAMIIVANHSHICWVHAHNDQSAMFKNPLNSAQMLVGNGRF